MTTTTEIAEVWYMAHPVGAPDRAGVDANCQRALRWLAWLRQHTPHSVTIVAPWLPGLLSGGEDDADPAQRERGLVDCERTVRRLTGVLGVGGRWSVGMTREREVAARIVDLTHLGDEPPATWPKNVCPIGAGQRRASLLADVGGPLSFTAPDRSDES